MSVFIKLQFDELSSERDFFFSFTFQNPFKYKNFKTDPSKNAHRQLLSPTLLHDQTHKEIETRQRYNTPFPLFLEEFRVCTHKGELACSSSKNKNKKGSQMPLVSRAGYLIGVCAPNSWCHGLNPKRADAEDHQVNEELLAACPMFTPFCLLIVIKFFFCNNKKVYF